MDPSRRSVLGASLFSVAMTVPDWPDAVGRMENAQSGQTQRVGMSDVDTVIAMTGCGSPMPLPPRPRRRGHG